MPKNHTDLIDELTKRVEANTLTIESLSTSHNLSTRNTEAGIADLKAMVKEIQTILNKQGERTATLESKCVTLEKHTDRTWQVWLALGAAIVALLVAFLKK